VHNTFFALSSQTLLITGLGTTSVPVTVTAPDPERITVTSTGYGPRGAQKVLSMEVSRFLYDIEPPAPIVIRGSDTAGDTMTFNLGNSAAKTYTGKDKSNIQAQLPTVAISLKDWTAANNGIHKPGTVADPKLSILDLDAVPASSTLTPVPSTPPNASQTPSFLQTAAAARTFLNDLQTAATNAGHYYTSFSGYADSDNTSANVANPGFNFVDGNCTLDGGSGLLVVTGTLTLKGTSDFQGIILVMGGGTVTRFGGGNGDVLGSWIVAKFSRTGTTGFTAPTFDVSGAGNSNFQFDTTSVDNALRLLGAKVAGIAEN
jgi:hypothetical protein